MLFLPEYGEYKPSGKCEYGIDDDEDKRAGKSGVNEFGLGTSLFEGETLHQMLLKRFAENVCAHYTEQQAGQSGQLPDEPPAESGQKGQRHRGDGYQ